MYTWRAIGTPGVVTPLGRLLMLKGPSYLGKSCYIRGGYVPTWRQMYSSAMNTFDATDYESVLRFSENCLVLEKSSFEIVNNY